MAITERQLSSLLATNLIPGTLRILGAQTASDVEDFFASRVCSQLADAETGMWQLGCTTLAQAYRLERAGIDYQEPRVTALSLPSENVLAGDGMTDELAYLAFAMEKYRTAKGITPAEVAKVFCDEGLSRIVLDNYYLYHIESPDHMIADLDQYRATGTLLDVRW